jgi:hypothetical protein
VAVVRIETIPRVSLWVINAVVVIYVAVAVILVVTGVAAGGGGFIGAAAGVILLIFAWLGRRTFFMTAGALVIDRERGLIFWRALIGHASFEDREIYEIRARHYGAGVVDIVLHDHRSFSLRMRSWRRAASGLAKDLARQGLDVTSVSVKD